MPRHIVTVLGLLALVSVAPSMAPDEVHLSIDASKPGPKINRNIFGFMLPLDDLPAPKVRKIL